MATGLDKALIIVKDIAKKLQKTHINLKKCSKIRLTRNYVESRLKCVEDYWNDYKQAHGEIISSVPREKQDQVSYLAKDEFYDHEEMYISLMTDLKDLLATQTVSASGTLPTIPSESQQVRIILP